jgi:hypothetical protein
VQKLQRQRQVLDDERSLQHSPKTPVMYLAASGVAKELVVEKVLEVPLKMREHMVQIFLGGPKLCLFQGAGLEDGGGYHSASNIVQER